VSSIVISRGFLLVLEDQVALLAIPADLAVLGFEFSKPPTLVDGRGPLPYLVGGFNALDEGPALIPVEKGFLEVGAPVVLDTPLPTVVFLLLIESGEMLGSLEGLVAIAWLGREEAAVAKRDCGRDIPLTTVLVGKELVPKGARGRLMIFNADGAGRSTGEKTVAVGVTGSESSEVDSWRLEGAEGVVGCLVGTTGLGADSLSITLGGPDACFVACGRIGSTSISKLSSFPFPRSAREILSFNKSNEASGQLIWKLNDA
jgi:hypothetical protein